MRHFYLFNIQKTMNLLGHFHPLELFNTLEAIYYGKNSNILCEEVLLKQLLNSIDVERVDNDIYTYFAHNYFYTKYRHRHVIRDVFRHETTIMEIHPSYIKVETNVMIPKMLEIIKESHTFFACDFQNKDYYWLDEARIIFGEERILYQK